MKKLKSCPCCGSPAEISQTNLPDAYSDYEYVGCTKCGLSAPLCLDGDTQKGITIWNNRVVDALCYSQAKRIQELEELAKDSGKLLKEFTCISDEDSLSKSYFKAHINEDWFYHVLFSIEKALKGGK